MKANSQFITITKIEVNNGQIDGLPKNPRFVKDEKFKKLVKSIEENPEMLEYRELLVYPHDGKYVVIGGNMRLRACKQLGYKEVPCKVLPQDTTIEQLKAYTIKDNSGFGEWDFDLLANEWDANDLNDWGLDMPDIVLEEEQKEVEEDDFDEEEPVETLCKKGDLYLLGQHRLLCGDATNQDDINKLLDGKIADLWLTDPPYNIAYQGGTKDKLTIANDNMESKEFLKFLTGAFNCAQSVLKKGGAFYVWLSSKEWVNFECALKANGLIVRQELVWNKNTFTLGRQDYQWKHEPCMYGWKDGAAHFFCNKRNLSTVIEDATSMNVDKMNKEQLKTVLKEILQSTSHTTIIDENKPARNGEHPTMKPLRLIGYLISNSTNQGELVLDTFGGSGSTLMASEQLGRCCYTMELDPHYCDVIIARWEQYTGRKAQLLNEEHN